MGAPLKTTHPVRWTPERIAWFRAFVPGHTEPEISAEHERVFGTPLSEGQIGNAKTKLSVKSGTHGGRFEKGMEPFNKGKRQSEFMSAEAIERTKATRFQKGQVSGIAKERMKPVGYERVDARDGYVWVKVKDTPQAQVPGSFNDNFKLKHHVVWEEANGKPVPPSTVIVFADHDRGNFDPDNLVAVPRQLWAVILHKKMSYSDRATLEACMAIARLDAARSRAERRPRPCKSCGREFEPRFPRQRTCDGCLGR